MAGTAERPRILYVEDEKDLREPLSKILEFFGYEVECAPNGQAGVELATSWLPDFILMDIRMPVMNGIEACRVLRNQPETADIPIYMLSAYTDAKTRTACEQAGASGFFSKPADMDKIDATIKEVLKR